MRLYERASRYGLDDELDDVIHAVERWREVAKNGSKPFAAHLERLLETFDALAEEIGRCESAGGHEHSEPAEPVGKAGIR
ncbi:MAG: hypothetical protein V3W44_10870 [Dehalococcoidales bacterium]